MQAPAAARHRRPFWVFALLGVAVAAVIVAGLGPPGALLPRSTVCQLGSLVGNYVIWTPDQPLNKPEGTNVSAFVTSAGWNFTFTSGSLTVGRIETTPGSGGIGWADLTPNAGISSQGTLNNWSFYRATNTSIIGGDSNACTQPYVAESSAPPFLNCGGFVTIPLQNNSSDLLEPHVWNGLLGPNDSSSEPPSCPGATPGAYVWFDTSFHQNATGASAPVRWDLCNATGSEPLYVPGVVNVPIVVYAPYDGREISASGFETWIGSDQSSAFPPSFGYWTASYEVPAGSSWLLAPIGPAAFPIDPGAPLPALVAFVREAC